MAESSDQTLVLLDRILARMKHNDERLDEISRHVERVKQSVEHLKQSTEEVMVAVACEENMFRFPPPPPCKEKPAFGLRQQPESSTAKVFNSRPEMRKCKEFLAQVSRLKSSPMSVAVEDLDAVVGTLGAVIPTRCSTSCPDHNDGKRTATTTRASTLATGKTEVREERTKQVEGANESSYKMLESLPPGKEELVVNLQQPGNHAPEVFDEMLRETNEPSAGEEFATSLQQAESSIVISDREGDDTTAWLWQALVVRDDYLVFSEMPQVIKLQQWQSQDQFMALVRPVVVMNSLTMLVRECAIKEDLVNSGSAWYVWLSSMRSVARSGIISVTFCYHLPPNIVTARNDQDTRDIDDNGWPALEGKISDAQLVFEEVPPWERSSFSPGNSGMEVAHLVFDKILAWSRGGFNPGDGEFIKSKEQQGANGELLWILWSRSIIDSDWHAGKKPPPNCNSLSLLTPATRQWDPGLKMVGSFITRVLILVLGYAYPAYDCYKTVELNRPEIEQLRFWCQYWILLAVLTVFERVGDNFISWLPMYSEAKLARQWDPGIPIMTRAQRSHPLDPLSAAEIAVAVATVRVAGKSPEERDSMRFVEVVLLEPEKNVVALADAYFFPPFQPSLLPRTKGSAVIPSRLPPRRAKLVVYNRQSNETSIWIVELSEVHAATRGGHHRGKVISSEVVPYVQPAMDAMEYAECEATVKSYPPFIEAMKRRGVDDMELVMVDAWCAGYYGDTDAPSRRLAKPLIFCRTESDSPMENGYARPVEGIRVVVDMQNNVVIEFEDRKLVPLSPPDHLRNYTPGETRGGVDRSDVKPLIINQPEGPSFRINGYFVEWQKWNFRIGFTPKEGLVIYSVAYVDGSRGRRPIAHRLSFVEMVVPYGDPNEPHYRKNAFDAGEDGLGKNAHSLKKGCDCLGYIKYFDAHFTNFTGSVETIENCVCLHEEDHGILWKHQDWRTGLAEVRRSRRLTVSFICTVANYEYGFYWHFYQDGKIEAEVKLTGILSLGALMPGESRKYGTTIAPGLYAPVHQHFFVARMDMAVDCKPSETHNQVVEVNVKVESAGTHNVHNNAFYAEEKLLKSELQAMRDCDPSSARHWIVRNTRTVNRTGQPTGYKLVPGSNCLPFALPEAKFLRRAGFLKHNLWVTPYKSDEMFPGGEFPNQNPRIHEGLATWVKKDRPLEETDIVLWYVFGLTHIPRLEDWPVMPVERIGFMLMPHGFFNCSPAVDVPPGSSDAEVKEAESPKAIQNALISKL